MAWVLPKLVFGLSAMSFFGTIALMNLLRKKDTFQSIWKFFSMTLGQGSLLDVNLNKVRLLMTFFLLYIFCFLAFWKNSFKCDLITLEKPHLINSLEDIIKHQGIRPCWVKGYSLINKFEFPEKRE